MKEYDRVELIVEKERYADEALAGYVTREILMGNGLYVLTKKEIY